MNTKTTTARPLPITVICSIGFAFLLLSLPKAFSENYFLDYTYTGFSSVVILGCLIGLWKMKKLAIYIYCSAFIVNQFVAIYLEQWNSNSLILPLVSIGIAIIYHDKMN